MSTGKAQTATVNDFASLMYQKGYRGQFNLRHPSSGRPVESGALSYLLHQFLKEFNSKPNASPVLELDTFAPYSTTISCLFRIEYDAVMGFRARELTLNHKKTKENRHYQFVNNHQVPGALSLEELFPQPKPWDRGLRGKFRL